MAGLTIDLSDNELDRLADVLAERVVARLDGRLDGSPADRWLDTGAAAEYLGVHRDTLRRLAAERRIPSEQEGPNCRRYFRVADLDRWRHGQRR
jgi:excisionase family DNA binding protein